MIPILFVISAGEIRPLEFDEMQRHEILLTILQSFLGFLLLLNLELVMYEALILFTFWIVQFFFPSIREQMIWVYTAWCAFEIVKLLLARKAPPAWTGLVHTWKARFEG